MFKTCVDGEDKARGLINLLMYRSAYFEVTPLPDDVWEFKFKDENEGAVVTYLADNVSDKGTMANARAMQACKYLLEIVDGVKPPYTKKNLNGPVMWARQAVQWEKESKES